MVGKDCWMVEYVVEIVWIVDNGVICSNGFGLVFGEVWIIVFCQIVEGDMV